MTAPAPTRGTWDDPQSARAYEAFCETHDRYRRANAALVRHAALAPSHAVLDVGAGTGRTAEAALRRLGPAGSVVCVEPSAAMASMGAARLGDARVSWTNTLPAPPRTFDRVLCGASVWLLGPLDEAVTTLAALVAPGGALCFDLPALYLGEADQPGGGDDPSLLGLWAALQETAVRRRSRSTPAPRLPDARGVEALLRAVGLTPAPWRMRLRLSQRAQADWLRIAPVSDGILGDLPPAERARRIDAALSGLDPAAWRWEAWRGWTAWRRGP